MGELILLGLVFVWALWRWTRDLRDGYTERRAMDEKVELRRRILAGQPDSPSALEALGDAMRAAGHMDEAMACYHEALERTRDKRYQGDAGLGQVAGAGLETKLRLARFEVEQSVAPEAFGTTMRTRQQVCRQCGALGLPRDVKCSTCGVSLPVDSMFDTLRRSDMRTALFWETAQAVAAMAIVIGSVWVASWMPPLARLAIVVAAIFVIPFRLLKHFTQV